MSTEFGAPHLEADRFRDRVVPQSDQRVEHRDIAYRAMHFTAELMAPHCSTLILDATYAAEDCRTQLMQVVERVAGGLLVVECHVSARLAVERFLRRGAHPAIDLTAERVARLAAGYRYLETAFAIGAGRGAEDELSSALQYARSEPFDASQRRLWCLRGQPRETGLGPLSAAPSEP